MENLTELNNLPQGKFKNFFSKRTPKLDEIISLLNLSNRYPQIGFEYMQGSNGSYQPWGNKLTLDPQYGINDTTLTHEHFHALDAAMNDRAYELNKPMSAVSGRTPEELMFLEISGKLKAPPNIPGRDISNRYRINPDEERAFGVGNYTSFPNPSRVHNPTANHIDATNATEMEILMDQYRRAMMSRQK